MTEEPAQLLAEALAGVGGAPARAGTVHVVALDPHDPMSASARGVVLLASAQIVRTPMPLDPIRGLIARARVVQGDLRDLQPDEVPDDATLVQVVPVDDQSSDALVLAVARLREAGVTIEVAPAVDRATTAVVRAGLPVPHGIDQPIVLTGDRADALDDWSAALADVGVDLDTPVVLLMDAGRAGQRAMNTTVAAMSGVSAPGPVVVVVGASSPVADWRRDLPLAGRRVLNLRAPHQATALSAHVRGLGGEPVEAPAITIEPGDLDDLDGAVRDLAAGAFTALCLTSPNGVDALADALARTGLDARALAGASLVAAVGPGTASALATRLGVVADLVPQTSTTRGLADAFPAGTGRVLLPRADIATNALADGLRAHGYEPVEVAAYRTVTATRLPTDVLELLTGGYVDLIPLLSSSMARSLADLLDGRPWRGTVVSIGPVTTETCQEVGIDVAVEAEQHDLDGIVAALCRAAGNA